MGILDGRVVLITDTGTEPGYQLALAIAAAGARVVVNDKTGAGSARAAADALAKTIRRRGGAGALPAYGGFNNLRDCMQMIRVAPDRWDWISGIVHIGPGADNLRLLLRAAQPAMAQWGGMIVTVNADEATAAVVTEQAESLSESRITLNAVQAGSDDITSMVSYLLSHHSSNVTGRSVRAAPDHTAQEIVSSFEAIVAAQAAPAKPAKPAAEKPAEKPAQAEPAEKPAQAEPAQAEPAQAEPAQAEPAETAPAEKPAQAEPAAEKSSGKKSTRQTSGKNRTRKSRKS
jgi:hypothetical protein